MAEYQKPLAPISQPAVLAILDVNWRRWEWDEETRDRIVSLLKRGKSTIRPLDEKAAAKIVAMTAEGWGIYHGVRATSATLREFFAWVAIAHCPDPVFHPYRDFCQRLLAAIEQNEAENGIGNMKEHRQWCALLCP